MIWIITSAASLILIMIIIGGLGMLRRQQEHNMQIVVSQLENENKIDLMRAASQEVRQHLFTTLPKKGRARMFIKPEEVVIVEWIEETQEQTS